MSHVQVVVHNPLWRPSVSVDAVKQQVVIFYRYNHNSMSTYEISVKAVTDHNCTSTSNAVKNSAEMANHSKSHLQYADYGDEGSEDEEEAEGSEPTEETYTSEEHNVKRKSGHAVTVILNLSTTNRSLRRKEAKHPMNNYN